MYSKKTALLLSKITNSAKYFCQTNTNLILARFEVVDQAVRRGVMPSNLLSVFQILLNDLSELLAKLNTPLIEAVDIPNNTFQVSTYNSGSHITQKLYLARKSCARTSQSMSPKCVASTSWTESSWSVYFPGKPNMWEIEQNLKIQFDWSHLVWEQICLSLSSDASLLEFASHFLFSLALHERLGLRKEVGQENVVVVDISIVTDARGQEIGRDNLRT